MNQWKKVKIGDFLTEREGRYKPDDKLISKYQRLDKIDFSGTIHISNKPTKTDMILVQPGDLVISGINVAKGAVTVYQGNEPVCATIHYSAYTFNEKIVDLDFFKFFVKSPAFLEALKRQVKGGIKTEIKPKHLLPLEISIPDLSEQKRIVAVLSQKLKKTEELQKEIDSQKEYVKLLRQNILQDCFCKNERIKYYNIDFLLAKNKKGMMTGPFGTMIKKSDHKTSGVPMLGIENIGQGKFKDGNKIFLSIEKAKELNNYKVYENDIIISRSGTVGEICSVPKKYEDSIISTNLIKLSLDNTVINPDFFVLLFQSKGVVLDQVKRICVGSTRIFLTQGILKKILFPLPSLAEQKEIVVRIEEKLQTVSELEAQIKKREIYTKQLMQGILKDTFEEK